MGRSPALNVLPRQRAILDRITRARTEQVRVAERARIVLMSSEGQSSVEQAAVLGGDPQRVRRWRRRWLADEERLAQAEAEKASDEELEALIRDLLSDEERSGAPPTFTAEQLTQIIELACKDPKTLGLPVTHWTPRELALAAQEQGIVKSISPRHIARFFRGGGFASAQVAVLAQPSHRRSRGTR